MGARRVNRNDERASRRVMGRVATRSSRGRRGSPRARRAPGPAVGTIVRSPKHLGRARRARPAIGPRAATRTPRARDPRAGPAGGTRARVAAKGGRWGGLGTSPVATPGPPRGGGQPPGGTRGPVAVCSPRRVGRGNRRPGLALGPRLALGPSEPAKQPGDWQRAFRCNAGRLTGCSSRRQVRGTGRRGGTLAPESGAA